MVASASPVLLLFLPGAAGRRIVLERLQTLARVCVLVPTSDLDRCAWAKAIVGKDYWIECSGATSDNEAAWAAVQEWLNRGMVSRHIDAVMTYDDFGLELCSFVGERLGVPCTPLSELLDLRNKSRFRERTAAAGLPTVRHATLFTESDVEDLLAAGAAPWRFPSVLKPSKGAGSWHVCKVDDADALRRIFSKFSLEMRKGSFPESVRNAGFVLEEYFGGEEVDVDGWARDGKVEFCMVSDNRPALEPNFLELGGVYPSQLSAPAVEKLEQLTREVVASFRGIHGCFHFEAKIDPQTLEMVPIEFNARCGGAECPLCVEAVSGYFLPEVAACIALGLPVPSAKPLHSVVSSSNIHLSEQGILAELCDCIEAKDTKLVANVMLDKGVGQRYVPNNGSLSCLGWVATGGDTLEEAERNLQTALGQVRITLVPEPNEANDQLLGT
mmetsp:Transcript_105055/g.295861  ORF Transcript_105055/g.295861 Transcript_105055/m.295861 type:complete len:442 (-) Transcript_105055:151-1476(-)